jgi:glycosyltransferase involved in cell wall biosynthesis
LIVGDGEERLNLQHLVQTEGLHEHVHFTGSIKHNNLGKYYAGCDLFLSLYDYSNAGNPLFEAMMNRCAIVTIDSPAMKYFISEKSAFLLKESSPETVGLVIQELILDKERLLKYGLNAEKEVKKNLLRWDDRIALEIDKIIELSGHQKS